MTTSSENRFSRIVRKSASLSSIQFKQQQQQAAPTNANKENNNTNFKSSPLRNSLIPSSSNNNTKSPSLSKRHAKPTANGDLPSGEWFLTDQLIDDDPQFQHALFGFPTFGEISSNRASFHQTPVLRTSTSTSSFSNWAAKRTSRRAQSYTDGDHDPNTWPTLLNIRSETEDVARRMLGNSSAARNSFTPVSIEPQLHEHKQTRSVQPLVMPVRRESSMAALASVAPVPTSEGWDKRAIRRAPPPPLELVKLPLPLRSVSSPVPQSLPVPAPCTLRRSVSLPKFAIPVVNLIPPEDEVDVGPVKLYPRHSSEMTDELMGATRSPLHDGATPMTATQAGTQGTVAEPQAQAEAEIRQAQVSASYAEVHAVEAQPEDPVSASPTAAYKRRSLARQSAFDLEWEQFGDLPPPDSAMYAAMVDGDDALTFSTPSTSPSKRAKRKSAGAKRNSAGPKRSSIQQASAVGGDVFGPTTTTEPSRGMPVGTEEAQPVPQAEAGVAARRSVRVEGSPDAEVPLTPRDPAKNPKQRMLNRRSKSLTQLFKLGKTTPDDAPPMPRGPIKKEVTPETPRKAPLARENCETTSSDSPDATKSEPSTPRRSKFKSMFGSTTSLTGLTKSPSRLLRRSQSKPNLREEKSVLVADVDAPPVPTLPSQFSVLSSNIRNRFSSVPAQTPQVSASMQVEAHSTSVSAQPEAKSESPRVVPEALAALIKGSQKQASDMPPKPHTPGRKSRVLSTLKRETVVVTEDTKVAIGHKETTAPKGDKDTKPQNRSARMLSKRFTMLPGAKKSANNTSTVEEGHQAETTVPVPTQSANAWTPETRPHNMKANTAVADNHFPADTPLSFVTKRGSLSATHNSAPVPDQTASQPESAVQDGLKRTTSLSSRNSVSRQSITRVPVPKVPPELAQMEPQSRGSVKGPLSDSVINALAGYQAADVTKQLPPTPGPNLAAKTRDQPELESASKRYSVTPDFSTKKPRRVASLPILTKTQLDDGRILPPETPSMNHMAWAAEFSPPDLSLAAPNFVNTKRLSSRTVGLDLLHTITNVEYTPGRAQPRISSSVSIPRLRPQTTGSGHRRVSQYQTNLPPPIIENQPGEAEDPVTSRPSIRRQGSMPAALAATARRRSSVTSTICLPSNDSSFESPADTLDAAQIAVATTAVPAVARPSLRSSLSQPVLPEARSGSPSPHSSVFSTPAAVPFDRPPSRSSIGSTVFGTPMSEADEIFSTPRMEPAEMDDPILGEASPTEMGLGLQTMGSGSAHPISPVDPTSRPYSPFQDFAQRGALRNLSDEAISRSFVSRRPAVTDQEKKRSMATELDDTESAGHMYDAGMASWISSEGPVIGTEVVRSASPDQLDRSPTDSPEPRHRDSISVSGSGTDSSPRSVPFATDSNSSHDSGSDEGSPYTPGTPGTPGTLSLDELNANPFPMTEGKPVLAIQSHNPFRPIHFDMSAEEELVAH